MFTTYRVTRTVVTNALNKATTYDIANGDVARITDPLVNATQFKYDSGLDVLGHNDAAGNRVSMRDRKGTTHTYTYDQINRLTQASASGLTVSHAYDANGNRTTLMDGGGTTTFAYDNLDRLTRKTMPDGRSVRHAYDRASNRTQLTYPDGTTAMTYGYDAANRLTQMTVGTLSWGLAYDPAGNRIALTQPNGTRTDYAYLTNNWLSSLTHKRPDGSVFQWQDKLGGHLMRFWMFWRKRSIGTRTGRVPTI